VAMTKVMMGSAPTMERLGVDKAASVTFGAEHVRDTPMRHIHSYRGQRVVMMVMMI
jgi:hypothetical protein